mmetsp:Transcript_7819/g.11007  ORF Transcript_7819/g.11007 Transcript_7819/m.11007 type:complete len:87 (+) Transcript_7819:81-341(+)
MNAFSNRLFSFGKVSKKVFKCCTQIEILNTFFMANTVSLPFKVIPHYCQSKRSLICSSIHNFYGQPSLNIHFNHITNLSCSSIDWL